MKVHSILFRSVMCGLFLSLAQAGALLGAEAPAALSVREADTPLFIQQDGNSEPFARLRKGDPLTPMAETLGQEIWYMVRTRDGQIGWVRAADVAVNNQAKQSFREQETGSSSWAAVSSHGQSFAGSYTVDPASTNRSARGSWSLRDAGGATVLRGGWSAEMHATGWNGTWRAASEGKQGKFNGSWSAELPQSRGVRFAEIFQSAAREAIRGLWTGGNDSGTWSIQTFK